jgi:hypothetical protein
MDTFTSGAQLKISAQLGFALGPLGREIDSSLELILQAPMSPLVQPFVLPLVKDCESLRVAVVVRRYYLHTEPISSSLGRFVGVSLEGAVIGRRDAVNRKFYGEDATVKQILYDGWVTIPPESDIFDLHRKLDLLMAGKMVEPSFAEMERKERLRKRRAEQAAEVAKAEHDDVEYVDARAEAKKEA